MRKNVISPRETNTKYYGKKTNLVFFIDGVCRLRLYHFFAELRKFKIS